MPLKIGLAFSIDQEESSDLIEKLQEVIKIHRDTHILNGLPESLSIIERLSRGMEISHKDLGMCHRESFSEDIVTAAWKCDNVSKEEIEIIEVALAELAEALKGEYTADRRVVLLFRQYIEIGGKYE
jgi:hypothetical protein